MKRKKFVITIVLSLTILTVLFSVAFGVTYQQFCSLNEGFFDCIERDALYFQTFLLLILVLVAGIYVIGRFIRKATPLT